MKSTILDYLNRIAQNLSGALNATERPFEYALIRTRLDTVNDIARELNANLPNDPAPELSKENTEE